MPLKLTIGGLILFANKTFVTLTSVIFMCFLSLTFGGVAIVTLIRTAPQLNVATPHLIMAVPQIYVSPSCYQKLLFNLIYLAFCVLIHA